MSAIGAIFTAFFSALSAFLLKFFLAKIAIRTAGVSALVLLSYSLVEAFNGYIAPYVYSLFSTQYGQLLGLLFPPISGTVIATLLTGWSAAFAYKLKVRAVKLTAGV